jgi:hypothetical protein
MLRGHVTAAAVGFVGPVFLLKLPSIDLNPVKAGLVRRPDDGKWSSVHDYTGTVRAQQERAAPSHWIASPCPPTRAPEYESGRTNQSSKPTRRREGGKAAESLKGETLRYQLDVPGIDAGLSRKEILDLVRESRRSTGRLLHKSRAPHKSPHLGKRSPSRQGSALNPA